MFTRTRDDGYTISTDPARLDLDRFGYLCDVYVDRAERGRGLGTWLAGAVRDHLGVRRILLATNDAHAVYETVGFDGVRADRWMELDQRDQAVSPLTGKEQPTGQPLTVEP
ncbi:GNAT family N-acetyltransferase [Micromonospora lutea]|uniref:N-acetyltransferase domain-containing protein n=1 Tax=Micromonospora lutea TaxID=419825 RepID=A0ABQ4IZN8_9ACTN|nr:GNAT family N-acetyltransferase [Micromonospora lutea]GIJ23398.1 hypothetical protein Vlu01_40220 [Micromonospora lutea]